MKKCIMIYNSKSGKSKSDNIFNTFYEVINEYGYDLQIIFTKRKGHATTIVKKLPDDVDLVIAAGGDGTLNEVITGNLKRNKKLLLAQLPIGTTNDVGTMYGYNSDYVNDLRLLLEGTIKNIDVCMINNKPFIYFAGIGNLVNVSYDTPRRLKEKYGRLGYIIYGIKEFQGRLKMYNLRYTIDGQTHKGKYSFVFVTNSSRIAGFDNIYDDVKLDDNKFEVLFANITSKASLIKNLYILKTKDVRELPDCEYYKTDNLKIEFDSVLPDSWCTDGEELKHKRKSFNFTISKEINLLVPKTNIDKLFVNKEE